jgi:hypothetical protein
VGAPGFPGARARDGRGLTVTDSVCRVLFLGVGLVFCWVGSRTFFSFFLGSAPFARVHLVFFPVP